MGKKKGGKGKVGSGTKGKERKAGSPPVNGETPWERRTDPLANPSSSSSWAATGGNEASITITMIIRHAIVKGLEKYLSSALILSHPCRI